MDKESRLKATVDGQEVEAEIIDESGGSGHTQGFAYRIRGNWRNIAAFVVSGIIVVMIIFLFLSVFIWALPVLVPVLIIGFLVRAIFQDPYR